MKKIIPDPKQDHASEQETTLRPGFAVCWELSRNSKGSDITGIPDGATRLSIPIEDTGGRILYWYWGNTLCATDPKEGLTFSLHGDLFVPPISTREEFIEKIIRGRDLNKADMWAQSLRGSFCLVVIDPHGGRILFVTDRSGTRKIFWKRHLKNAWFSTSIDCLPDLKPDPAGIASMISNNFCFLGRTLVAGVSTLERSSVHEFSKDGLRGQYYWEPDYGSKETPGNEKELESTYAYLMSQAVRRRIPEQGRFFISLSGGIDSRALLGLLSASADTRKRLHAFSYGENEDEDVRVPHQLCRMFDIPFNYYQYQGDLAQTIRRNGQLCQGMVSFYTHGLDSLFALSQTLTRKKIIFVGDIAFRQGSQSFKNIDEMLQFGVGIRTPAKTPHWFGFGDANPLDVDAELNADIVTLKERVKNYESLDHANQFLLLDQRQNHQILPWREFYAGAFLNVVNPLIDEDILDFVSRLPSRYTFDKLLHKNTVKHIFPQLCSLPVAASGIDNSRVFRDFILQRRALFDLVDGFDSSLDDIVPPDVIKAALANYVASSKMDNWRLPGVLRKTADRIRLRYAGHNLKRSLSKSNAIHHKAMDQTGGVPHLGPKQLGKILSIRCFFRQGPHHMG